MENNGGGGVNHSLVVEVPVLSKIMEKHVNDSFYRYLCDNNLLYSQQSGFRKYHSTRHYSN